MKRPHDLDAGTKLTVKREVTSGWGWKLPAGQTVELVDIRTQPTRFEVKDRQGRTWVLSTFDVETEATSSSEGSSGPDPQKGQEA